MFHRLALPVALIFSATLTACGSSQTTTDRSVRSGPQIEPPVSPGPNNQVPTPGYAATAASNAGLTCPQGSTLVSTQSGVTSCTPT
ncbi:hypothetical protein SAMN06265373_106203 [Shimia sagamensis]|uniref:Uncharacterized protein n=1 Tax=Shimia sagamensis TaxID=1566352 RepID=A0ABY1P9B9_9RHOB|nr:hypothetical protein SAMN06265373_106203 [Shimia sagamensis]